MPLDILLFKYITSSELIGLEHQFMKNKNLLFLTSLLPYCMYQ